MARRGRPRESALGALQASEARRAEFWREAAHDLRGNVSVVSLAAGGLKSAPAAPDRRDRLVATLDRSVGSLTPLLEDVASPAGLQGGHETRAKGAMDAGHARAELVRAHEALAQERGLFLRAEGPETLPMGSSRRAGGARRVRVWLRRRPAETARAAGAQIAPLGAVAA